MLSDKSLTMSLGIPLQISIKSQRARFNQFSRDRYVDYDAACF